jgi:hypothetical protein
MQRNISHQRDLTLFLLLISLITYEEISTIHNYLPPLFGFMFLIFLKAVKQKDKFFIFLSIIYLLFFEADRDFLLFSSIVFYFITVNYIEPRVAQFVHCNRCLIPIFIFWIYIGYFLFNNITLFILNIPMDSFNTMIIYYACIESIIATLLLGF